MLKYHLVILGLIIIILVDTDFMTTAESPITISSPNDGARLTSQRINITGKASGVPQQWVQTNLDDFNAGIKENVSAYPPGDLHLDNGIYDDFQDNILNNSKWSNVDVSGGINYTTNNQSYEVFGTSTTGTQWGCHARIISTHHFNNIVYGYLYQISGSGNGYYTYMGVYNNTLSWIMVGCGYDSQDYISLVKIVYQSLGTLGEINIAVGLASHQFAISWSQNSSTIFMDGVLEYTLPNIFLGTPQFFIDSKAKDEGDSIFASWDNIMSEQILSGNYTSIIHDTGVKIPELISTYWNSTTIPGTSLIIAIRSNDTQDSINLTKWVNITNFQNSGFPDTKRYIQYHVFFNNTDYFSSSVLHDITIIYNTKPLAKIDVSIDNQLTWQPVNEKENWFINLDLPENQTIIWARVMHPDGSYDLTSISVDVDTTPPEVSLLINNGDKFTANPNVTLTINATDRYGIASMLISEEPDFRDAVWQDFRTNPNILLSPTNGIKTVFIKVKDTSGWESTVINANIILDTQIPAVSLLINGGATYTNTNNVNLSTNYTDNNQIVAMQISNNIMFSNSNWDLPKFNCRWNLSNGDGLKIIYIRVRDNAGNEAINSSKIILDTIPPISTILSVPAKVDSLNFSVSWNGTDSLSGIHWFDIQYRNNSGLWTDWIIHTNETKAIFLGQDGHIYFFRIRAQDNANNLENYSDNESYSFEVVLPNILPIVSIAQPKAGSMVSGIIHVEGTAYYPQGTKEIQSVRIKLDSGEWEIANDTSNWWFDLDTTRYNNGIHIIYVQAFDGQNYSLEVNRKFLINNQNPSVNLDNNFSIVGFIIILFIVAIIYWIFVIRPRFVIHNESR